MNTQQNNAATGERIPARDELSETYPGCRNARVRAFVKKIREETITAERYAIRVEAQRDQLLAELKRVVDFFGAFEKNGVMPAGFATFNGARAAIAAAEGNSDQEERPEPEDDAGWRLSDEGRSDGYGESYGERNT